MGFLQNQNLTVGFPPEPEVAHWESTPHPSSAVNNTVIMLGVLTFALQLCLALFFMLRCWRLDSRVREALKHQETVSKPTAPSSLHLDMYNPASYRLCDEDAAASRPAVSAAVERYEPIASSLLFAPSVPWDLVQR